jgi:conjugative relaxase-like TrwC/TraI family protein
MLFINHASNSKAAKDYFTEHLSKSDYYMRDAQEVVGEWHGRGAELLGLSGQVDKDNYFRLCENINPLTGEQLTPRTKNDRRVLYDFTFDAPKSVTLAYEVGGDDRIMDAFRQSVADTMGEMEDVMRVRVRKDGAREDRQTCNMVWGEFIHRTTRPVDGVPDPQLHCHAVAFNASYDQVEDRWKAGEFEHLVRDKGYFQAAFHSRFAEKLAALGYGIERDGKSFRLAGIDETICWEFSRRTQKIEEEARRLGITDPAIKRKLGRLTREAKSKMPLSMAELREVWNKRLEKNQRDAITGARAGRQTQGLDAEEAVNYAMSHAFERGSVVTKKKFLETALIQSFGKATPKDVRNAAIRDDLLVKDRNGRRYVTTRDVLAEEDAVIKFAVNGKATRARLSGDKPVRLDAGLSDEQRNAALSILNSQDRVIGLRGKAGTGKTTMMHATIDAIQENGKQVFTFAPSAEASRGVLRKEGFKCADTVERLLIDKEMQSAVKDQVVWVDEAGLLSVKDMKRVFDMAKEQNARVILSGDSAQHNSVLRGDALRILEEQAKMPFASLTEIHRQTKDDYRKAVGLISEGDAPAKDGRTKLEHGLEMMDRMGAIIEAPGENRYRMIAEDYADVISQRKFNPQSKAWENKTSLIVAPTHAEIRRVTKAVREVLKEKGNLKGKEREFTVLRPRNFTEAERTDAGNYKVGDIVQFHKGAGAVRKRMDGTRQTVGGFKRGERVKVVDAGIAGVTVAHADGKTELLPLKDAASFQVYATDTLALAKGDKVRGTMNGYTRETRRGLLGRPAKSSINNGAIYEVEGFTRDGDIKFTNGYVVPKDYGGLTYGYVVTSHASQGKTVDVPLIAIGSESFAAANREQLYVSYSRGREAARIYTDDKAGMMEAVRGTSARLSATELMADEVKKPKRKSSMAGRIFHHVHRAFHRLRERIAARDYIHAYEAQHQQKGLGHAR